jgi:hypothetical protein
LEALMVNVILHVGLHKTGTTSIQAWLRDHPALLAESRIRFPRGWLQLDNHFELPLTLMRLDRMTNARRRSDEWRDPRWRAGVLRQVLDDLRRHPDEITVLSSENLSWFRHDDEFIGLREVVGDAHIVIYLRNKADFLASLTAHFNKNGMPGVSSDPSAYNYVEPDTWLADYDARVGDWKRWFTNVTVLDYDHETAGGRSVVASFVELLGVPVPDDVDTYRLNTRGDRVRRPPGNRTTTGSMFGESPDT